MSANSEFLLVGPFKADASLLSFTLSSIWSALQASETAMKIWSKAKLTGLFKELINSGRIHKLASAKQIK